MKDYQTQKEHLKHFIDRVLNDLGIQNNLVDEKLDTGQTYPMIKLAYRFENLEYDIRIFTFFDYYTMFCYLFDTKTVNEKIACTIFHKCLELNYRLPNTTFSSIERKIFVELDIDLGTTSEEFPFQINGLTIGIEEFTKYLKTQNLKIAARTIS